MDAARPRHPTGSDRPSGAYERGEADVAAELGRGDRLSGGEHGHGERSAHAEREDGSWSGRERRLEREGPTGREGSAGAGHEGPERHGHGNRRSADASRDGGRGKHGERGIQGPARRRAILITAVLALLVDGGLWLLERHTFERLPPAYWLMGVLAIVVDARPYVIANRRSSSVVLPSICFTFGIGLAWGFGAALAVQMLAVTVAGVRLRHSVRRTLHLSVQHAVALGAVAAVAGLVSLHIGPRPDWDDALLTVAAASAWILARYGLAALAGRILSAPRGKRRRGVEVLATGALLLLGPVVLATAQVGLAFVPLVLLALHAIHRMVRSAGESERASRVDALTGLPNRRALASVHERGRLALLLLDLDRFRTVNDALGHAVGDRLLIEVAHRLAEVVPAHDLVVRLGGDEFAVLATRVDGAVAARRLAHHLAEALNRPFALDGVPVDVSASIGIALRDEAGGDGEALLREAEAAMYDAKQRGDQVAVYGPDAAHHSPDRLALLGDLRRALREGAPDDGITLFYQPQIAIASGEVVGVEALLRWRHPDRGMIGPEELIRVAEPTPAMRLLTERVLHDVTVQLARWREAGRRLRASVNVSVRDLHSGEIAERIDELLHTYGVPADLLQLEITESALMADPHRVLKTITRLDRMGIAISLDDFGTGYSSLQHLRRLPLSEVKIDRSFVLGMATDRGDAAIVRSVIDLADALGLRAVAEGVEDERTWRLLAAAGCHAAQGWFHARPMPAADLDDWLARYRPLRPVSTS